LVGRVVTNAGCARGSGKSPVRQRERLLSIENVTMGSIVKNMSFSIYAGEVVAITGLIGSGRTEIAKIVAGVLKRNLIRGGMIFLRGRPIRYRTPKQAINDGIVYITEDRKVDGFFETMPVDDNIYLALLASRMGRSIFFSSAERRRVASRWIARLSIHALRRNAKVIEYSGGNQQKGERAGDGLGRADRHRCPRFRPSDLYYIPIHCYKISAIDCHKKARARSLSASTESASGN
jgi:ABC-type sugar transport system ATPase subunit